MFSIPSCPPLLARLIPTATTNTCPTAQPSSDEASACPSRLARPTTTARRTTLLTARTFSDKVCARPSWAAVLTTTAPTTTNRTAMPTSSDNASARPKSGTIDGCFLMFNRRITSNLQTYFLDIEEKNTSCFASLTAKSKFGRIFCKSAAVRVLSFNTNGSLSSDMERVVNIERDLLKDISNVE